MGDLFLPAQSADIKTFIDLRLGIDTHIVPAGRKDTTSMSERTDMQRPCLDLLESLRQHGAPIAATRTNSGKIQTIHRTWINMCDAGWPDITASIDGKFVGIETKFNKGKQSKIQKYRQEIIQTSGGIYLLVDDLDVLREYLEPYI